MLSSRLRPRPRRTIHFKTKKTPIKAKMFSKIWIFSVPKENEIKNVKKVIKTWEGKKTTKIAKEKVKRLKRAKKLEHMKSYVSPFHYDSMQCLVFFLSVAWLMLHESYILISVTKLAQHSINYIQWPSNPYNVYNSIKIKDDSMRTQFNHTRKRDAKQQ